MRMENNSRWNKPRLIDIKRETAKMLILSPLKIKCAMISYFGFVASEKEKTISAAVLLLESRWHLFQNTLEIQAPQIAHFIFI